MNGFLILNKDSGLSSFFAARKARNLLGEYGEKKVGHTGTLDPMATGVLVVALGRATSFIDLLDADAHKKYRASFVLGTATDTLDITGTVLKKENIDIDFSSVTDCIKGFVGESMQTPPMYSALKIDGKRLYDLARQGIEVEREQRKITIFAVSDFEENDGEYSFTVECSKGTYIRSLIGDIGEKLGTCACMTRLTRLSSDGFDIEKSVTLEQIESSDDKAELIIPVEDVFSRYGKIELSSGKTKRFQNGGTVENLNLNDDEEIPLGEIFRVYDNFGSFLGLGEYKDIGLTVKKLYKIL